MSHLPKHLSNYAEQLLGLSPQIRDPSRESGPQENYIIISSMHLKMKLFQIIFDNLKNQQRNQYTADSSKNHREMGVQ